MAARRSDRRSRHDHNLHRRNQIWLAQLPFGRRRVERELLFNNYRAQIIEDRVFAFDVLAAETYGGLVAAREWSGRPLAGPDGFIAAIAASRGLKVANRDISGFDGYGLRLINPRDAAAP